MTTIAASGNASRPKRGMPVWIMALCLFMAVVFGANGVLIWLSSRGHRDLVREDYYQAGLAQDKAIARAAAAGTMSLRRDGGAWMLENDAGAVPATGCRLRFYRPDDGRADHEARMERLPSGAGKEIWRAPATALRHGRWIVTAVWERDGQDVSETSRDWAEP